MRYKLAKELGVTELERNLLLATLKDVRKLAKSKAKAPTVKVDGATVQFNMRSYIDLHIDDIEDIEDIRVQGCKTAACFAGFMVLHAYDQGKLFQLTKVRAEKNPTLYDLERIATNYAEKTMFDNKILDALFQTQLWMNPKQAVERLVKFLSTGTISVGKKNFTKDNYVGNLI